MSPRAYIFQRPFLRGLSTEGNLGLKIDWTSLIVGSKFTVFALLYFVFEGSFSNYKPPGGLYLQGRFKGGFFTLPVWGAYIWKGLYMEGIFSEFYGILWKTVAGCPWNHKNYTEWLSPKKSNDLGTSLTWLYLVRLNIALTLSSQFP